MPDALERAVNRVVANDNCSGCGGCALVSSRVTMQLQDGYMRPSLSGVGSSSPRAEAQRFRAVCPGARLVAPKPQGRREHPTFGPYVAAYEGFALDAEIRERGSSGGVLTALAAYVLEVDQVESVVGVRSSRMHPARAVPVKLMKREDALNAAGSRYSPVAVLPQLVSNETKTAVIGKPCEVSAASQWLDSSGAMNRPLLLSFFCAGVPSQNATTALVEKLGVRVDKLESLRYRGEGWPGNFVATDSDGNVGRLSYEQSWGAHLGKTVQWRCKLCPDGTGAHADIAVGDFWNADERGFPIFEDAEGNSVVIARTERGHALLEEAAAAGVIALAALDLDRVAAIQPLQVKRKRQLAGRLLGRLLGLKQIPLFRGYGLIRLAAPYWRENLSGAIGAAKRSAPQSLRRLLRRGASRAHE